VILYQRTFFLHSIALYIILTRPHFICIFHMHSSILSNVVIGDCVVLHDAPQRERISAANTRNASPRRSFRQIDLAHRRSIGPRGLIRELIRSPVGDWAILRESHRFDRRIFLAYRTSFFCRRNAATGWVSPRWFAEIYIPSSSSARLVYSYAQISNMTKLGRCMRVTVRIPDDKLFHYLESANCSYTTDAANV